MDSPALTASDIYKSVVPLHDLLVDIEELNGFSLCWIGSRTAKSIILYACGGGLVVNAYPAHILTQVKAYFILQENSQDISIAIIAYSLCPASPWPNQLSQMVEAVQHLLETREISSIHLSGDSAGANLQLSLLQHIATPYPSPLVPTLNLPSSPPNSISPTSPSKPQFASAFLFSPTPAYPFGSAAQIQNPVIDITSGAKLQRIWDVVMSTNRGIDVKTDRWLVPVLNVEEGGWKGLPVGRVEIVFGGGEVLGGDIGRVGEGLVRDHEGGMLVQECEGEVHCQMMVDVMRGLAADGESAIVWKRWLRELKA